MTFPLKIVTAEGVLFEGEAEKLILRTASGDAAILARHMDCLYPLGPGRAVVESEGQRRTARCAGGLVRVSGGTAVVMSPDFRWE